MISRKRIIRFVIGKMLRQDRWAEKYNPKNQSDVNQYDQTNSRGDSAFIFGYFIKVYALNNLTLFESYLLLTKYS